MSKEGHIKLENSLQEVTFDGIEELESELKIQINNLEDMTERSQNITLGDKAGATITNLPKEEGFLDNSIILLTTKQYIFLLMFPYLFLIRTSTGNKERTKAKREESFIVKSKQHGNISAATSIQTLILSKKCLTFILVMLMLGVGVIVFGIFNKKRAKELFKEIPFYVIGFIFFLPCFYYTLKICVIKLGNKKRTERKPLEDIAI